MARLLYNCTQIVEDWHPLSGAAAPEYIPERWDGPHVGKRLIEAFKTLSQLPARGGPVAFGSFWPEMFVEWHDELAQAQADEEQKAADARAANRVRIRPTAHEITVMEQAIVWPARYLVPHRVNLARAVGFVALWRSREQELGWIARRLRVGVRVLRLRNRRGLDLIAAGLQEIRRPSYDTTSISGYITAGSSNTGIPLRPAQGILAATLHAWRRPKSAGRALRQVQRSRTIGRRLSWCSPHDVAWLLRPPPPRGDSPLAPTSTASMGRCPPSSSQSFALIRPSLLFAVVLPVAVPIMLDCHAMIVRLAVGTSNRSIIGE
jgi:hypothetical protein